MFFAPGTPYIGQSMRQITQFHLEKYRLVISGLRVPSEMDHTTSNSKTFYTARGIIEIITSISETCWRKHVVTCTIVYILGIACLPVIVSDSQAWLQQIKFVWDVFLSHPTTTVGIFLMGIQIYHGDRARYCWADSCRKMPVL